MNEEKILELYRKLMAKANGTENEAEALAFMSKAQELLTKHNLTEADARQDEAPSFTTHQHMTVDTNKWRLAMFSAVAKLYFCRLVRAHVNWKGKYRPVPEFVGRPHNVEIAISMALYLEKTVIRLAKEAYPDRKSRLQFENGCGMRIATRVFRMAEEMEVDKGDGSGLPALYKNEAVLVEDYLSQIYPNLGFSKAKKSQVTSATLAGRSAGEKVHLGGQVGGASHTGRGHLLASSN